MLHGFRSSFDRIAHVCSDFGHYLTQFQGPCFQSGNCEGAPGIGEARRDYRAMLRARYTGPFP